MWCTSPCPVDTEPCEEALGAESAAVVRRRMRARMLAMPTTAPWTLPCTLLARGC